MNINYDSKKIIQSDIISNKIVYLLNNYMNKNKLIKFYLSIKDNPYVSKISKIYQNMYKINLVNDVPFILSTNDTDSDFDIDSDQDGGKFYYYKYLKYKIKFLTLKNKINY